MSDNNDLTNGQENAGDAQACCDGDSCCPSGPDGSGKGWKMVVFLLIIVAAGLVLARSLLNKSNSDGDQSQQVFASILPDNEPDTSAPLMDNRKNQDVSVKAAPTLWKADLNSLASLNTLAAESDAVFVLLAARDKLNDQAITKEIESAAQKIMANGKKVSAFRLKESAADYAQLSRQVSIPSVIAMVKGRGMRAVSGEITELKLVQAFVAASKSSSCGPSGSGCGPTGCAPTPAKPGPRR